MSYGNSGNRSKVNKQCKSRIPWDLSGAVSKTIRARKPNKLASFLIRLIELDAFNSRFYDARSQLGATVGI